MKDVAHALAPLGASMIFALLVACGGGSTDASSAERRTDEQATEDHITAGDESTNSGGHGEDPNASHDPEGADGVHDEAVDQPHPDEAAASTPE